MYACAGLRGSDPPPRVGPWPTNAAAGAKFLATSARDRPSSPPPHVVPAAGMRSRSLSLARALSLSLYLFLSLRWPHVCYPQQEDEAIPDAIIEAEAKATPMRPVRQQAYVLIGGLSLVEGVCAGDGRGGHMRVRGQHLRVCMRMHTCMRVCVFV